MEIVRTDLEMRIRITDLLTPERYEELLQEYDNNLETLKDEMVKEVKLVLSDNFDLGNETCATVVPNSAALCVERICDD